MAGYTTNAHASNAIINPNPDVAIFHDRCAAFQSPHRLRSGTVPFEPAYCTPSSLSAPVRRLS